MLKVFFASLLAMSGLKTEVQVNICESYADLSQKIDFEKWQSKNPEKTVFIENKDFYFYKKDWVFKVKLDLRAKTAEVTLKNNKATTSPEVQAKKKCEFDLHGTAKKMACKLIHEISLDKFYQYQQSQDFAGLLSDEQLLWLQKENVDVPSDLEMTTPFEDQDYVLGVQGTELVLGVSTSARRQHFIEISARSEGTEELKTQNQILDYLKQKNVQICQDQGSLMTRLKLESFFNP